MGLEPMHWWMPVNTLTPSSPTRQQITTVEAKLTPRPPRRGGSGSGRSRYQYDTPITGLRNAILKRLASDEPPLEEDERDRQQHDRHRQ